MSSSCEVIDLCDSPIHHPNRVEDVSSMEIEVIDLFCEEENSIPQSISKWTGAITDPEPVVLVSNPLVGRVSSRSESQVDNKENEKRNRSSFESHFNRNEKLHSPIVEKKQKLLPLPPPPSPSESESESENEFTMDTEEMEHIADTFPCNGSSSSSNPSQVLTDISVSSQMSIEHFQSYMSPDEHDVTENPSEEFSQSPSLEESKVTESPSEAFSQSPSLEEPKVTENSSEEFPQVHSLEEPKVTENSSEEFSQVPSLEEPKVTENPLEEFPQVPSLEESNVTENPSEEFSQVPSLEEPKVTWNCPEEHVSTLTAEEVDAVIEDFMEREKGMEINDEHIVDYDFSIMSQKRMSYF